MTSTNNLRCFAILSALGFGIACGSGGTAGEPTSSRGPASATSFPGSNNGQPGDAFPSKPDPFGTPPTSSCDGDCNLAPGPTGAGQGGSSQGQGGSSAEGGTSAQGGSPAHGGTSSQGGSGPAGGSSSHDCSADCAALDQCTSGAGSPCSVACPDTSNDCAICIEAEMSSGCTGISACNSFCGVSEGTAGAGGASGGPPGGCDAAATNATNVCMNSSVGTQIQSACSSLSGSCVSCLASAPDCASLNMCKCP